MIQTDTPQYPWKLWRPLLNENKEIIGLNTAVSEQASTLSFTIPHSYILDFSAGPKKVFWVLK